MVRLSLYFEEKLFRIYFSGFVVDFFERLCLLAGGDAILKRSMLV